MEDQTRKVGSEGDRREKPFFLGLVASVEKELRDSLGGRLQLQSYSDEETLSAVSAAVDACAASLDEPVSKLWRSGASEKSPQLSTSLREEGNERLRAGDLRGALTCYNGSIAYSVPASDNLAMAYSNRSVCMQKMNLNVNLVIRDLNFSLDSPSTYSKLNQMKLLLRLGKALQSRGDIEGAKSALEKLQRASKTVEGKADKDRERILKDAARARSTLNSGANVTADSFLNEIADGGSKRNLPFPRIEKQHEIFGNVSDAIEMVYEPCRGRYSVASRDVGVGEILIVDTAVVESALMKEASKHCTECSSSLVAPLPCARCATALYCSQACLESAEKFNSHRFDCALALNDLFEKNGVRGSNLLTQSFVALKTVLQMSPEFFTRNAGDMFKKRNTERFANRSNGPSPVEERYLALYNMVVHFDETTLYEHLAKSVILLRCLIECGNLRDSEALVADLSHHFDANDPRRDPRVFFARLLFHFSLVLISNNHSISEISKVAESVSRDPYGLAIFPTAASLLNHSCDPNTSTVTLLPDRPVIATEECENVRGTLQVTFATKIILKGEEICHVYQGHFGDTALADRRATLRNMFSFTCGCVACTEDYPKSGALSNSYADAELISCKNSSLVWKSSDVCPGCGKTAESLESERLAVTEVISEAVHSQRVRNALELYSARLSADCLHLKRPHLYLLTGRAAVTDCIWLLHGKRAAGVNEKCMSYVYN